MNGDASGAIVRVDKGPAVFIGVGETKNGVTIKRIDNEIRAYFAAHLSVQALGVLDPSLSTLIRVKKVYGVAA
jgi:hypothetical protein